MDFSGGTTALSFIRKYYACIAKVQWPDDRGRWPWLMTRWPDDPGRWPDDLGRWPDDPWGTNSRTMTVVDDLREYFEDPMTLEARTRGPWAAKSEYPGPYREPRSQGRFWHYDRVFGISSKSYDVLSRRKKSEIFCFFFVFFRPVWKSELPGSFREIEISFVNRLQRKCRFA